MNKRILAGRFSNRTYRVRIGNRPLDFQGAALDDDTNATGLHQVLELILQMFLEALKETKIACRSVMREPGVHDVAPRVLVVGPYHAVLHHRGLIVALLERLAHDLLSQGLIQLAASRGVVRGCLELGFEFGRCHF